MWIETLKTEIDTIRGRFGCNLDVSCNRIQGKSFLYFKDEMTGKIVHCLVLEDRKQ